MDLPTLHPRFRPELELLVSIPIPGHARLADVAEDLGVSHSEIGRLCTALGADYGIKVVGYKVEGAGCIAVSHDCHNTAKQIAGDYWQQVYGEQAVLV
jgi:hypothetical protein